MAVTVRVGSAGFMLCSSWRNASACRRLDSSVAFTFGSEVFAISALMPSISFGSAAICFWMNGTPPTPASGRVRFSFVLWEAMTSAPAAP